MTAERPERGSDTVSNTGSLPVSRSAGPISRPDRAQNEKRDETEGLEHVSNIAANHSHAEPVLQERAEQPRAERNEYRRAVVRLSGLGYGPKEIAAQTHLSPTDVTKILREAV